MKEYNGWFYDFVDAINGYHVVELEWFRFLGVPYVMNYIGDEERLGLVH